MACPRSSSKAPHAMSGRHLRREPDSGRHIHRETGTYSEGQARTARGGRAQRNVGERLKGAPSRGTMSTTMEIPWQSEISLHRRGAYHNGSVHDRGKAFTITGKLCGIQWARAAILMDLRQQENSHRYADLSAPQMYIPHTAQQRIAKRIRNSAQ
jgi:hypothetical protein